MEACGLIVEYNPFHNGHLHHLTKAKEISKASCMIAIMSGSFLQRGEPAIIDKFHRTKAALLAGVDMVIELPYPYAVQSSEFFAKGAILSLNELNVSSICFGSESGDIKQFYDGVNILKKQKQSFDHTIRTYLDKGYSFPKASSMAYEQIGVDKIDMFQPNNILGFSYVKSIIENNLPMKALTIKRIKNDFHDQKIYHSIASATSIRKELNENQLSKRVTDTLPSASQSQIQKYKEKATLWHTWEDYFPFLHYQVFVMTKEQLSQIHGVDEGLENRLKRTAVNATSFQDWIDRMKTKRYTQTRLQRMFVHILTNTSKRDINRFFNLGIPYIRLLGMNTVGRHYLNTLKKKCKVPIISNLNKDNPFLFLDEKATKAYYSILPSEQKQKLRSQELQLPIIID